MSLEDIMDGIKVRLADAYLESGINIFEVHKLSDIPCYEKAVDELCNSRILDRKTTFLGVDTVSFTPTALMKIHEKNRYDT